MTLGICKGCKKRKELDRLGYCSIGSCGAESVGADIGSKLFDMFESWASQYVSKTTLKLIFGGALALMLFIYIVTNN